MASPGAYARSGFELRLRERLNSERVPYEYERDSYRITLDVPGKCSDCGSRRVTRDSTYTPDFFFRVWVVEAKGKFTPKDRKRVLALVKAEPQMKFGMLFMRDNWLTKRKVVRYTQWCEANNIPAAVGWFKPEWLR